LYQYSGGYRVTTVSTYTGFLYNAAGKCAGYKINEKKSGYVNGVYFESVVNKTRSNIVYDSWGRIISYKETAAVASYYSKRTGFGQVIETNETYSQGRMTSWKEVRTGPQRVKETRLITNIAYNARGQIVGYKESYSTSAAPLLKTTIVKSNITYNSRGQVTGFREVITETGPGLRLTINTTVSNVAYNSRGQIVSYVEVSTSSAAPGLVTVAQRINDPSNGIKNPESSLGSGVTSTNINLETPELKGPPKVNGNQDLVERIAVQEAAQAQAKDSRFVGEMAQPKQSLELLKK